LLARFVTKAQKVRIAIAEAIAMLFGLALENHGDKQ
jgi:hypothetical protein